MSVNPARDEFERFLQPDGRELGRVATLCSPDDGASVWAGIWVCEPQEWVSPFEASEVFHVLQGAARVELDGETVELEPGHAYYFAKGEMGAWRVSEELKAFVVVV